MTPVKILLAVALLAFHPARADSLADRLDRIQNSLDDAEVENIERHRHPYQPPACDASLMETIASQKLIIASLQRQVAMLARAR
jgi:hypothetical protein